MVSMQTVLDQISGREMLDSLIAVMFDQFEDFAEDREKYTEAMETLQNTLCSESIPSVEDEMDAIHRQIASDLLFSGILGLKANLDNFIDPIARNFLDVDPETYLRENVAHSLPEYQHAQNIRNQFFALLSADQQETYEGVIPYVSYLETVGPKLAHYYGFLLGNELWHRVVPGYHPDMVLTMRYRAMLSSYLGNTPE